MKLCDFLTVQQTSICSAQTKKTALIRLSELLAQGLLGIQPEDIFDALIVREKLASTAIGLGIALPHARLTTIHRIQLALLKLPNGVDFKAQDGQTVDLFLAILVPGQGTNHHFTLLSHLTNILQNPQTTARLRACTSTEALFQVGLSCIRDIEIPDDIALIEEIQLDK